MSPARVTASENPLRDPRDKRLPRIAGPCSMVLFGVLLVAAMLAAPPAESGTVEEFEKTVTFSRVEPRHNSES